jgi:hypothetical protein
MTDSAIGRMEAALADASNIFAPFASKAVLECDEVVQEIIQVYAPQPARTRARTFNTYVRGRGRYPKSAFVADATQPGGYKIKRIRRGSIKLTSQQLDKRWKKEVVVNNGAVVGTLRNTASYSGYVNGWQDSEPRQVSFHAASGWVSADKALAEASDAIDGIIDDTVQKFLDRLVR